MALDIRPLHRCFGAELAGLDLRDVHVSARRRDQFKAKRPLQNPNDRHVSAVEGRAAPDD